MLSTNYCVWPDDGTTGPTPKPEGTPVPKKIAKLKAAAMKKNRPDAPAGCLVRACLHNKKISTVVIYIFVYYDN